jgi:hypothetical protein
MTAASDVLGKEAGGASGPAISSASSSLDGRNWTVATGSASTGVPSWLVAAAVLLVVLAWKR